jgi:protein-S-isoprenylcysteine O-methyltransferase Ste14
MQFDDPWYADPSAWIAITWMAWAISWLIAWFWSKRTAARAGAAELPSLLLSAAGFYFVLAPRVPAFGPEWDAPLSLQWVMTLAVAAGAAFAWWGRAYLGALWSFSVTRKEQHRIIDTGPYAIVRHPIYTGLIGAAFATAIVRGHFMTLVGAGLLALGFWLKARLEERLLSVELGAEYSAYRKRVPMLVPFAPF